MFCVFLNNLLWNSVRSNSGHSLSFHLESNFQTQGSVTKKLTYPLLVHIERKKIQFVEHDFILICSKCSC